MSNNNSNLQDVAAERAVLAGIVQYSKDAFLDCNDILLVESFTQHVNQILYSILEYSLSKNLDCKVDLALILSNAKEIGLHNELQNETKYVLAIFNFNVELSNIRTFAIKLRKLHEARNLLSKIDETATCISQLSGDEPLEDILAIAEKPIFEFSNKLLIGNQQIRHVSEGLDSYVQDLSNEETAEFGIDIGYSKLQNCIGGITQGVHVITARPGVGKSTAGVNGALHASCKTDTNVCYLDTEMTLENGQWCRMLSRVSGVEFNKIRSHRLNQIELKKIQRATTIIKGSKLDYLNISSMAFESVLSILRRWVQKVGYDTNGRTRKGLIIYDYLKLTDVNQLRTAKEYELIGYRMSLLHDFSVKTNIPIITFVQQNRENDVSQSDRVLWFATSLCSLHKKTQEEIIEVGPQLGNLKLFVEKARFGSNLEDGNYIGFHLDGRIATMVEIKTRNEFIQSTSNN